MYTNKKSNIYYSAFSEEFSQNSYNPQRKSYKRRKSAGNRGRKSPSAVILCFFCILLAAASFIYIFQSITYGKSTVDNSFSNIGKDSPQAFVSDEKKKEGKLSGKTIIIDAGHGGLDVGAIYPPHTENPDYIEATLTLSISEKTKKALEDAGATVIMLREDDSFVGLYKRAAMTHLLALDYAKERNLSNIPAATEEMLRSSLSSTIKINSDSLSTNPKCMGIMAGTGASDELTYLLDMEKNLPDILFLSIHANTNPDRYLHGTCIYYVTDDSIIESTTESNPEYAYTRFSEYEINDPYYGRNGSKNALLAQIMYNSITENIPHFETNGHQTIADNYAVLREQNLPSVMIETAFLSNDDDRYLLHKDDIQEQIAAGILEGCIQYFSEIN